MARQVDRKRGHAHRENCRVEGVRVEPRTVKERYGRLIVAEAQRTDGAAVLELERQTPHLRGRSRNAEGPRLGGNEVELGTNF